MTVYYVLHVNEQTPYGGVQVIYRHVDILNRAGIDAKVVHGLTGFRCTWFDNDTAVAYPPFAVSDRDVLVYPDVLSALMCTVAPGIPKVSLNQNAYLSLPVEVGGVHPYLVARDLLAVTTVSRQNEDLLRFAFPDVPLVPFVYSVDPALFWSVPGERQRRIAYMPRRRKSEVDQLLAVLRSRGALEDWELVPLDGMTKQEVAEGLRGCALFLSFSHQEGLGLPPLEALISGCSVIGFSGFGGTEFFDAERECVEIPDGDIREFSLTVESWLRAYPEARPWEGAAERSAYYSSRYSPDKEVESVLALWREVSERMPLPAGAAHTLMAQDTGYEPEPSRTRRRLRHAKRAVFLD